MNTVMGELTRGTAMVAALASLLLGVGVAGASAKRGGSLDAFVVRERIYRDLPKINRCYESVLRYEPELAGKVSVNFAVARRGDVRDVRVVKNTTGSKQVGRCVTRVVGSLRFKRRRSGKELVRFTFPFVFAPQR